MGFNKRTQGKKIARQVKRQTKMGSNLLMCGLILAGVTTPLLGVFAEELNTTQESTVVDNTIQ